MAVFFFLCLGIVLYTYVGYPLLVAGWAKVRPRPVKRGPFTGSVSIVLAAHNEERALARRLEEFLGYLRHQPGEIIVVSDGSRDRTVAIARSFETTGLVRILELQENVGKAAALTKACQLARNEIIVFADCRQTWANDALGCLLENFADPEVGGVSGDLVLESSPGVLAGVGLYWRFEKWLRKKESLVFSQVGVTGAIAACRREKFTPIPAGTLLDDVYWPLRVAMQGERVIHDERAKAVDRLPDKSGDEFRRKVRTLTGCYQLAALIPGSLVPWRNPVWLAWISHKLLRLVVPWAFVGMLAACCFLEGHAARIFLGAQVAGYVLGLAGMIPEIGTRVKVLGAGGSFLVLNAAAWLAFWKWVGGGSASTWRKVHYPALPVPTASVGP